MVLVSVSMDVWIPQQYAVRSDLTQCKCMSHLKTAFLILGQKNKQHSQFTGGGSCKGSERLKHGPRSRLNLSEMEEPLNQKSKQATRALKISESALNWF